MDYWSLGIIRSAVLHDLAEFVPPSYDAEAVPKLLRGLADWKLGKMLRDNSSMTVRQASANQVLELTGLWGATTEALAKCQILRSMLPHERADVEGTYDNLTGWADFATYKLTTCVREYASHLPANKAQALLSLIEITVGNTGTLSGREKDDQKQDRATPTLDIPLEQRMEDLFDPLTRAAIMKLFIKISENQWYEHFKRGARNGLREARQDNSKPLRYNPLKVGEWLIRKGLFTRGEVYKKLAASLPQRSKSMKYLFTEDLEYLD